jgi:hypothetical protein
LFFFGICFLTSLYEFNHNNQYLSIMKKLLIILGTLFLLASCNSAKRNQRVLAKGDYEKAIALAVKKLHRDNTSGKNDVRIELLEDAFKKYANESTRRIGLLKKQQSTKAAKEVYYTYQNIEEVQDQIRPLLPLFNTRTGKEAKFKIVNYNSDISAARLVLMEALVGEAQNYENRGTLEDFRTAYYIYCELEELAPNYNGIQQIKENARFYGTDYVHVTLNNGTGQIIPLRLERELLDFNTYGLDDFWTQYHSQRASDIDYNLGINLNFEEIAIRPERISEVTEQRSNVINDGWEYVSDRKGNILKDSLGNNLKRDVFITVVASITYTTQEKTTFVGGNVLYRDLITSRDMDRFPLTSEFIFENTFARYRGDERALTDEDLRFLNNNFIPFPSNEQMVFDAGEDVKLRLKDILSNNNLR